MNKKQIENFLRSIFSIFIMVAIAGGAIIFILFIVALFMGSETGGKLAVDINNVYLPYFIKSASVAIISGLLIFYLSDTHALSLNNEKDTK